MAKYPNGDIPDSALITFHTGWSVNDKDFKWQLPPSTYRKHLALVARAKKRTGRSLSPSQGWSCYRPYRVQIYARQMYGNGAATPGTSSHGGFWEGKDTAAIDYGNWGHVYSWNRDAFYTDCRAVGLTPGQIHPSRNRTYPDEPWHVIDLDPWAAVPAGSIDLEDEMSAEAEKQIGAVYAAIFGARNLTGKDDPISWVNVGGHMQNVRYGLLPITIHNQTLIGKQAGQIAGIKSIVEQLASANGAVIDMAAVEKAAERGAKAALSGLVLTADVPDA